MSEHRQRDRYFLLTGILFSLVGILHLLRAANQWEVLIGEWVVPLWVSWVLVALAGYLVVQAWRRLHH